MKASTDPNGSEQLQAEVTIRPASSEDAASVEVLRQLDTRPMPAAPLILAEVDGTIVAARSLASGEVIADPFRRTTQLAAMLRVRAAQLATQTTRRRVLWDLVLPGRRHYARFESA
jgi:hypothetical protein